mmetsp:Transcript_30789/g.63732  ORF Transcript_30789/g.63732 Transcript_30789/m.63732 type:complete len:83 (-) Transcript_30789:2078-2326(-)
MAWRWFRGSGSSKSMSSRPSAAVQISQSARVVVAELEQATEVQGVAAFGGADRELQDLAFAASRVRLHHLAVKSFGTCRIIL